MHICVYLGSRSGHDPRFVDAAHAFGHAMAQRSYGLVYGGASSGLMGAIADIMVEAGCETYGVIPEALHALEVAHTNLTELIITNDMHQRKKAMLDKADAFVALPGGLGTFEELLEAWTWQQLGYHNKPVALLNCAGFYDSFLNFLDHATDMGFVGTHHRQSLIISDDAEKLLDLIETTKVVYVPKNPVPPQATR